MKICKECAEDMALPVNSDSTETTQCEICNKTKECIDAPIEEATYPGFK